LSFTPVPLPVRVGFYQVSWEGSLLDMRGQVSDVNRDLSSGERSRPPILSIFLAMGVIAIFADLAMGGVLLKIDALVASVWTYRGPYDYPFADFLDPIGQRLICLPILFGVAYWLCRRLSTIRPLVIAVGGTLLLNFVIGLVKIATERQSPRTGGPELFSGDNVLFPSGHTANVIFVYGLAVALLIRYGKVRPPSRALLISVVGGLFALMTVVSVYRHTHWFSDLVAGGMIAGAVLELTLRVDTDWPLVRSWLKRTIGPAWVVVEVVVGRLRPVVIRPSGPSVEGSRRARRDVPDAPTRQLWPPDDRTPPHMGGVVNGRQWPQSSWRDDDREAKTPAGRS
jgi:membrane-associated phospholipid phosphatase